MPPSPRPGVLARFLLLALPLAAVVLGLVWFFHVQVPEPGNRHPLAAAGGLLALVGGLSWLWASAGARRDLAVAELRRSRETARAILDAPQDAAFLLLAPDGRILACNPVAAGRFHLAAPADLEGRNLFELGGPELAEARRAQFRTVIGTGRPVRFEDVRAGLVLDNTLYPAPAGEDGSPRLVLLSRDVTGERRNREQLLLLSRAVEQSPAMVLITDPEGRIEYVNPRFTQVYGYTGEEILGENPRLLKSGCQPPEFYARMWETILAGSDWNGEMCNRTKDGREIWERAAISPVTDERGRIIHFVAVKEDVTEERRARQELAESEEKVRAMSEASQDALIMIDDQDRVAFWNPAAERIFGYARDEVLGRSYHDLVVPGSAAVLPGEPPFDLPGQEPGSPPPGRVSRFTARRRDGSTFPVELSVASFQLRNRWWAVGTARDVTEQVRREARLRELATTDGLTGLFNRRHFLELAGAEIERARRYDRPLSLVMFDVDHFKDVNDTFGHAAGDLVLKTLAATARGTLREVDLLGRLGGEEFAAILPETGRDEALGAAERLRRAVAATSLMFGGQALTATVSVGLARFRGGAETLEEVLKRADNALYEAKLSGRNRTSEG